MPLTNSLLEHLLGMAAQVLLFKIDRNETVYYILCVNKIVILYRNTLSSKQPGSLASLVGCF